VIAAVVAPVLQAYAVPPVAVRVAEPPRQSVPSFATAPELSVTEVDGVGAGLTVIVVLVVAEQPFAFVTVTVYVVVATGLTVSAAVVAPVLQTYAVPPAAVMVTAAPEQVIPSLAVVPELSTTEVVGVGSGLTVIVTV